MKVPLHLVRARRQQLADWMQQHGHASLQEICTRFAISEATARRDLAALEQERQIVRTYGGALSEYNHRFASFRERQGREAGAKAAIARQALAHIHPGSTLFLDAGTTVYAIAEALARQPVTPLEVVTNNLPVADLLAAVPEVRLHVLGGELLFRQSVLVGPAARSAFRLYRPDLAFLGAEGMDARGLWNSQEDVAAFQREVVRRSGCSFFCLDSGKIAHRAPVFLLGWKRCGGLLTDASLQRLASASIPSLFSHD